MMNKESIKDFFKFDWKKGIFFLFGLTILIILLIYPVLNELYSLNELDFYDQICKKGLFNDLSSFMSCTYLNCTIWILILSTIFFVIPIYLISCLLAPIIINADFNETKTKLKIALLGLVTLGIIISDLFKCEVYKCSEVLIGCLILLLIPLSLFGLRERVIHKGWLVGAIIGRLFDKFRTKNQNNIKGG